MVSNLSAQFFYCQPESGQREAANTTLRNASIRRPIGASVESKRPTLLSANSTVDVNRGVLDFRRRGRDLSKSVVEKRGHYCNSVSPRRVSRKSRMRNDKTACQVKRTDCVVTAWRGLGTSRCTSLRRHLHMSASHGQHMRYGQESYQEYQP